MDSETKLKKELTQQYGRLVHEHGERGPYIILHRSLCEAMPSEWQKSLVALMEEIEDYYDYSKIPTDLQVNARGVSWTGKKGVYIKDPFADLENLPKLPYRK